MTKTEEILVALMDGDTGPLARFVKTLSNEDLAKLREGLVLFDKIVYIEGLSSVRWMTPERRRSDDLGNHAVHR